MLYDVSTALTEQGCDTQDYEDLKIELLRVMALEIPFDERALKSEKVQNLSEQVYEKAIQNFKTKMDRLAEIADPVIKNVYETQGDKFQNIMVPISDGKRVYNISCDLKEAYDTDAKGVIRAFEKSILLHTIDEQWKEHLREMDDLRHSVQNASYEQKDPLLIYKLESFNLFKTMVDAINRKAVSILMRAQIPMRQPEDVRQAAPETKTDYSRYRTEKSELPGQTSNQQGGGGQVPSQGEKPKPMPIRVDKKPGRNDPCFCGSGKKFKNCHGQMAE
jgi:preprotein translocase subunit SecA